MYNLKLISVGIATSLLLTACGGSDNKVKHLDTPTSGSITIAVDESFKPIMEAEIATFEGLYPDAKINPIYVSEGEAYNLLMKDSVKIAVGTRKFTTEEMTHLKSKNIIPSEVKIANDAVALLVNPANKDTAITYANLLAVLEGKLTQWKAINNSANTNDIQLVFDNKNSSTARFIKETLLNGKDFSKNCFAVKTNPEVIDYVAKNVNSIGIIGVNWISDGDDPIADSLRNKVKVMAIQSNEAGDHEFYQPYQAYLSLKKYALVRDLYIVSREARNGLGTGFASFIGGDKGQRIILKSGILPATMPVRIVGFRNE